MLALASAEAAVVAMTSLPLPTTSYVRLEPTLTVHDGEASGDLTARGVLVYRGLAFPDVDPKRAVSAIGIEVSAQAVAFTQLSGVQFSWGTVGAGLSLELPRHGDGLTAGPAVFAQVTAMSTLELGLLARSYFELAGNRASAVVTRIEPDVVVTLPHGFQLSSDGEIDVDWLARTATVPVSVQVGHQLGSRVLLQIGPEVEVAGPTRGDVIIDLEIDFLAT